MRRPQPVLPAAPPAKPLVWIGSSRQDIRDLPREVQAEFGRALFDAQVGRTHVKAKPLKGFGGAGVLEVVKIHDGDTFRAIYTVRLAGRVYVLDVFQKKSKSGVATPKSVIDRIKTRLKRAELEHQVWLSETHKDKTP